MNIVESDLPGVFLVRPDIHMDSRGPFHESFRADLLCAAVGMPFPVAQVNFSTSRRGTIRGLHGVVSPPGQAKYVTCVHGALRDIVVDLRIGSPTFGEHTVNLLEAAAGTAVLIPEGFGHGFQALTDEAQICYVLSTTYVPGTQFEIHPFDPDLQLPWDTTSPLRLSEKDARAHSLRQVQHLGLLSPWSPGPGHISDTSNARSQH